MRQEFAVMCVSPQDWDVELPTNRQQIMRRVARRGHRVLFVETSFFLGRHVLAFVRNGGRVEAARKILTGDLVDSGVSVQKAMNVLPWGQRYRWINRLNVRLTARLLRRRGRRLGIPYVLWIYDPAAAGLIGSCGELFAVYDCVDDYPEQARDPRRRAIVEAGDRIAGTRARLVFTTSRTMFERQSRLNVQTHLVPNVGDFEHFVPAQERMYAAPELASVERPTIGFAGNFLPTKVDFDLLDAIAAARPGWTLLLVGPAAPDSLGRLEQLARLPNVRWLGPKPYRELPRYVAAFDVGIIPYAENPYTRSCFPLKLYEYLAAGKPVVASGLPELAGMEPHVVLAADAESFVAAVESALRSGEAGRAERIALASRNTWDGRAERLLSLVGDELSA
jgi:glycosyltransferase involved in cell wall biosynthesis